MRKIIISITFALLACTSCFSQMSNNDTLNKIEKKKDLFRRIGLANLDKIEGIYFGYQNTTRSGWDGPLSSLNGKFKYDLYFIILKDLNTPNQFNVYDYYVDEFRLNPGKYFIEKEDNKYKLKCCVSAETLAKSNLSIDNGSEVTFDGNNISFTSKTISSDIISTDIYNSEYKIFPRSLEDNIFKTGTGFFISKNGYVVTNYHVIKVASNIYVSNSKFKRLKAEIEFVDEYNDIAILKVPYKLNVIPYNILALSKDIGDNVFTLGYPFVQSMGKEVKLTNGIINSNSGYENDIRYYQFSAEIQPGNSGGPLFDSEGNIVGLVSSKHNKATNAGYALKAKFIIDFIKINDPAILKTNINSLKNLSLTSKYKILKDYVLLLEIE